MICIVVRSGNFSHGPELPNARLTHKQKVTAILSAEWGATTGDGEPGSPGRMKADLLLQKDKSHGMT